MSPMALYTMFTRSNTRSDWGRPRHTLSPSACGVMGRVHGALDMCIRRLRRSSLLFSFQRAKPPGLKFWRSSSWKSAFEREGVRGGPRRVDGPWGPIPMTYPEWGNWSLLIPWVTLTYTAGICDWPVGVTRIPKVIIRTTENHQFLMK